MIFWFKSKKPILALAPMAGFTDSAFRQICKKFGADVVYSEMASASGLFYNPKKTLELLKFKKIERPYIVQLFGSNPEHFAKAAKIITEKIKPARNASRSDAGGPNGIDINFGCPVKKVMKTGAGCALMANPKLAREIIKSVYENTNLPVSIKIRVGIHSVKSKQSLVAKGEFNRAKKLNAINFIKKIKDLPFQAVMVHCRTYEQGFSGMPDYSIAEKIKKIIPGKIVLINGGINSAEDAVKILKKYPTIDGLGIARGALGRPWIFEEIHNKCHPEFISGSKSKEMPKQVRHDREYIQKIFLSHLHLVIKNKGSQGLKDFRVHIGWYIKGFPGASELRRKLVATRTFKELETILKKYRFSKN